MRAMKAIILRFSAIASCIALGTSTALALGELTTLRIIQTQTLLARRTATEYQRRVAEQNAKAFFKQLTPEKKAELKKKKVRTVLIRTVRSRETSPAAKDVRMRYDLAAESLADNQVVEFATPLEGGTIAQVKSLDAYPEYVGQ